MKPDRSWEALLKPGDGGDFFSARRDAARALEPPGSGYGAAAAWCLAELSRLIYRRDRDEEGKDAPEPTRTEILEEAGFEERLRFHRAETYGALVTTRGGGERVAALVFRGTNSPRDWLTNLRIGQGRPLGGGLVHDGFFDAFESVWDEVRAAVLSIDCALVCTGHSLGGALATVAAARLREEWSAPRCVYTFGSPRVGNGAFAESFEGLEYYRIVNGDDCVERAPPSIGKLDYSHAGTLIHVGLDGGRERSSLDSPGPGDRTASLFKEMFDPRRWFEPPDYLSDHAPVNYVKSLEPG